MTLEVRMCPLRGGRATRILYYIKNGQVSSDGIAKDTQKGLGTCLQIVLSQLGDEKGSTVLWWVDPHLF